MVNHKLKQASFLLNVKQLLLYNLLSDQSKHDQLMMQLAIDQIAVE